MLFTYPSPIGMYKSLMCENEFLRTRKLHPEFWADFFKNGLRQPGTLARQSEMPHRMFIRVLVKSDRRSEQNQIEQSLVKRLLEKDGKYCEKIDRSMYEVRKVNLKWKLSQSHKLPLKSSRVQPSPSNRPIVGKCYSIQSSRKNKIISRPFCFRKIYFQKFPPMLCTLLQWLGFPLKNKNWGSIPRKKKTYFS